MRKIASSIIGIVLTLVAIGLIMLASTSSVQAAANFGDPSFFVVRQFVALVIGLIGFVIMMRIPYEHWRILAPMIAGVAVIMLIMVIIPGVGIELKGSRRWLRFGPVNIQPSELGKFAMIILMAKWLSFSQRNIKTILHGVVVPVGIIGVFTGLLLMEPDFGTTMLMGVVALSMMFAAGTRISYLSIVGVVGLIGISIKIANNPNRLKRILAFLNPEEYALDQGFQLLQAKYAHVVGGFSGVGLGESLQKRFYLPEAHTDFIFAIIGEELGLMASLFIVLLFCALFVMGMIVTFRVQDVFGRLLAFGLTMMVSVQAAINIGVVTGCLPTKGLPLPFISYGGTSLAISLAMMGVLVNVAYNATQDAQTAFKRKDRSIKS